jgi:hypothetical protein
MIATHKTFGGMARAVERLAGELDSARIDDDRDYKVYRRKVSALFAELNALWSNPADVAEAARLKNRLSEAWHAATN